MTVKNKKVVAIIQARHGSTRLPGKVLEDLAGQPMLARVINRTLWAKTLGTVVVATTTQPVDDVIAHLCKERGWAFFRGSEEDVLSRYYETAVKFGGDVIVRLTSDCPLIDPRVIDGVVEMHLNSGADYTSGSIKSGFPRGLDTEVFNFETLKRAYKEAKRDYEREHVTPYIHQHPNLFKLQSIEASGKLRRPDLRLTVDTEEDLTLIREIFKRLYRDGQIFYTEAVIDLLDEYPELIAINAHVRQKGPGEL